MMARCIELDMQCSAICYTSAQMMSMGSEAAREICRICADLCNSAGMNALNIKPNIAGNAPKVVKFVRMNGRNGCVRMASFYRTPYLRYLEITCKKYG